MDDSDYGTLNESRNAAIVAAANLLEAADKAKRLRKRFISTLDLPEEDPEKGGERKDFLLDLTRLNANYMNQLASIGKKHGDIANSALEKLYRLMVPPARRDASAELRFENESYVAKFLVRNDCSIDSKVRFEPRGFVPAVGSRSGGAWLLSLKRQDAKRQDAVELKEEDRYACDVAFGDTGTFVATIHADLLGPRLYTVELIVRMGETRKTIPVLIDLRRPEDIKRTGR